MLIYDKKGDTIEIYTIKEKTEELKKYKKGVISRCKEPMFYSFKTNIENTAHAFENSREIWQFKLNRDYYSVFDNNEFSSLEVIPENKEMLNKYILGDYNTLKPIISTDYDYEKQKDKVVHKFIRPEEAKITTYSSNKSWTFNNVIDLPQNLYLLQLLLVGDYKNLVNANISKQLSLFEIEYLKSVNLLQIKEMIETGLVSGTLDEAVEKAEIGSKVLSKRK